MKIINRTQFLAMPAGTLFSKYAPCYFEALLIKGESTANDFFYSEIADAIESVSSCDFIEQLFHAELDGVSLKMDFDTLGRDGLYDDGQLFAVWERPDVEGLIKKLQETLNA